MTRFFNHTRCLAARISAVIYTPVLTFLHATTRDPFGATFRNDDADDARVLLFSKSDTR